MFKFKCGNLQQAIRIKKGTTTNGIAWCADCQKDEEYRIEVSHGDKSS